VGALTVAALGNVKHKGRIALVMLTCLGACIAGFAVSTTLWLSCLMLFISGAALISVFALVNSLVQLITTNEMRGRVMSVYNFAFRGGMPLGNLMTGWLVPMFSAPIVLAVNGVVLMAVALYFLIVQRRVAAL
jgi:predicted MFS family arabinose efflux permease